MADYLLEIGTEPLPARFVAPALEQLSAKLQEGLRAAGLAFGAVSVFGTLRRLTVVMKDVAPRSPDRCERVKGPPDRLLKDAGGAYTPQAAGFARKFNLAPERLAAENGFLWARVDTRGEKAPAILSRVSEGALRTMEFPKSLEWEPSRFRFGRPIRSISALLGGAVVPLELAAIKSGRKVWGLSALQMAPISLKSPAGYLDALRRRHVIADIKERKELLLERLAKASNEAGGRLDLDADLVEETVFMTEQPTPVVGRFSEDFLALPSALLALVMKKQLKFFPVLAPGAAGLKAAFVAVRDGLSEGEALVREGYQRVLAARGNDAVFFFRRDLSSSLESKLPMLGRVTYQKGLGTMEQKSLRVTELTNWLCRHVRQDRPAHEKSALEIARLCYADLVTEVVKEFPELQGLMGGVYARKDGLDERVGLGLEQFYLPAGPKSPVPTTIEGALVSLAGKLDSMAGQFAQGQAPTGSADPFGLRRQALGALRIVLEHQLPIDLPAALEAAARLQPVQADAAKVAAELQEFLWGRAQSLFEDKGFRVDEIRSVRQGALTNLKRTFLRLAAIHAVRRDPDFEPLAEAFKRASNILRQAQYPASLNGGPERSLLRDDADLALFDALSRLEAQVHERLVAENYEQGLRALVGIKPHLDRFFEKVMVMVDDAGLREQRLRLLARLVALFLSVADLAEIQAGKP
jgi:glycyl-tRNA synthetase beta chain